MALVITFDGVGPSVAASAWVAPNATLVGSVTLGERASVFYGAVLRGDMDAITIGDDTNLQDNVTMHVDDGVPATVGARVSVGHAAVLHGCTVEDDCLIGMSATVLNRAVIGAGSLVAAGSVVLEGTVIPPRSLVAGVPAKVRREITDEEFAKIQQNAQRYLTLSAAHKLTAGSWKKP
jgi:carbonic anhydrase/acetyltransferase-like protein (isoleucine patch superfamily)